MNEKNSHIFISCYLNDNDFLLLNANVLFFELKTRKAKNVMSHSYLITNQKDKVKKPLSPCSSIKKIDIKHK
jgi:hypothetical protein